MRLRHLLINLTFIVLLLAPLHVAHAFGSVEVVQTSDPSAPIRILFDGLTDPMIVQRSTDLENWEDLFVATADFNGEELVDPTAPVRKQNFYRLLPIDEPLRVQMNMFPGSSHLARIVSGRQIEIDIFGARDAEGYPTAVTSISYRVGNRHFVTEPVVPAPQPRGENPPVPIDYFSGLVVVRLGGDCVLPSSLPVVQYVSREDIPGGANREYSGETKTVYVPELSDSSQAVYRYTVPFWFSHPCQGPTDLQRAFRGLEAGLSNFASALSLATGAVILAAGSQGVALPVSAKLAVSSIGFATAGLAAIDGTLDDEPYNECTLVEPLIANETEIRAIIPNGDSHFVRSSPWFTETNPTSGTEGPALVIDIQCHNVIEIIPAGSHIRTNASFNRNGSEFGAVENLVLLDSLDSSASDQISTRNSDPFAFGSGAITASAAPLAILYRGRTSAVSDDFRVTTTGQADGKLVFRIIPTEGVPQGQSVDVEIRTTTDLHVDLRGTLSGSNGVIQRTQGETVVVRSLRVGDLYSIAFFVRHRNSTSDFEIANTNLVLTLLGNRKD